MARRRWSTSWPNRGESVVSSLAFVSVFTVAALAAVGFAIVELIPSASAVRFLAPAVTCGAAYHFGYDPRGSSELGNVLRLLVAIVALPLLVFMVVPNVYPFDGTILPVFVNLVVLAVAAGLLHRVARNRTRDRLLGDRVLILGMSPIALRVAKEIRRRFGGQPFKLALLDGETSGGDNARSASGVPVLGSATDLPLILESFRPTGIVVALGERRNQLPTRELLACRARGVRVESGIHAYERFTGKLAIETLNPGDLLFSDRLAPSAAGKRIARLVSCLLALVGAVLTAPLMVVVAIAIRLTSDGPVFFVQERTGYRGKSFRLFKFRTMIVERTTTSEWEIDNLDRITRLGYWLRKSRLDELPQLWNILRGDMNLVGPRPHPVTNQALFESEIPFYGLRSMIRPGLTGWAQVHNGYANDLAGEIEKMRYDLHYVAHQSIWLDLQIVLKTALLIFHEELESHGEAPPATAMIRNRAA